MTWTPISDSEMQMARHVVTYIKIARQQHGPEWLPGEADLCKSALLERLRSGKEPLAEPPPLGMSCPWYALVEDKGPHYVFDVWRGEGPEAGIGFARDEIAALQNPYKIVQETKSEIDFIVRDGRHDTSYRFRLWYDAEWRHPGGRVIGGWFMQNTALLEDKRA